jgi:hypothetical protein
MTESVHKALYTLYGGMYDGELVIIEGEFELKLGDTVPINKGTNGMTEQVYKLRSVNLVSGDSSVANTLYYLAWDQLDEATSAKLIMNDIIESSKSGDAHVFHG